MRPAHRLPSQSKTRTYLHKTPDGGFCLTEYLRAGNDRHTTGGKIAIDSGYHSLNIVRHLLLGFLVSLAMKIGIAIYYLRIVVSLLKFRIV